MARIRMPREKKIPLAGAQRQALIPAEKLLWKSLRNREFAGYKFRRQHPIGPYVVDFACVEAKLVVELDGESHLTRRREDEKRTTKLEAEGWLVLRLWNTEVYDDLEAVKEMIYRTCIDRTSETSPPSPPAPLPPPTTSLQTTSRSRRRERGARLPMLAAVGLLLFGPLMVIHAQAPSYSKDIRPLITKYCLECHNARTQKGTLSLETFKAAMEGSDRGPVIVAGQPDKSKLVLLTEHKDKPTMPPAKAKFHPTKDEVALLRAWVAAGAVDDGANIKVELPTIKAKADVLPPVTGIVYEPKIKRLVFSSEDQVVLMDLQSPKASRRHVKLPGQVTALALSDVPGLIIAGVGERGKSGNAFRVDDKKGPIFLSAGNLHADSVLDVSMDANGMWTATAGFDSTIYLRADFGKFHLLKEHSDAVYGLAFNPDGTLLASVSADRAMKVFDVEKGKLLYTLGDATDWLYTVAWSPDGKYLVSGGVDKSIRVYEPTRTGAKLRQSVFAHEGPVQKAVFTSDSKTLYSVGQDRVVKAWDIEKMVERKVYDAQPETVLCLALREDAGQFIVGRYDGIVQLIDMKTGVVKHEFGAMKGGEKRRKGEGEKKPAPLSPRYSGGRGAGGEGGKRPLQYEHSIATDVISLTPGPSPPEYRGRGETVENPTARDANPLTPGPPPPEYRGIGETVATGVKEPIVHVLDRAGAVHSWRINVVKGQSLGIEFVKLDGSKIDPVLTLADPAGRIVAESYDGLLGHTFAEAGAHTLGVRDRDYRGGPDFKYRYKLGKIPIVTAVFPMGLQHGTSGEVKIEGVFLPKNVIKLDVPKDAKVGQAFPIDVGPGVLGKAQIIVGEWPEVLKQAVMPVPGTANGRIDKENQKDVWPFKARKGQQLIVEVNARRLGSRLDSVIEILDKNDQPVPRAVLRSQAKTHVTFRDHDSAGGGIRIEAWSELATNDLLYVGNELMKIQSLPTHPDADCNFFVADGKRLAYLDTTPTHHANNAPMYKVSVHPPGTTFPPNGYPVFTLYYRNDDGGPGYGRDSRLIFDPPADGEYKVRIADARGMGGVNFGYRLTVRRTNPHFTLRVSPQNAAVSKGSAIPITFSAERIDGYDGPIDIKVENLPQGFHLPDTTIEAGTYSTTVALFAGVNAAPATKVKPQLEGWEPGAPTGFITPFDLPTLIEPGDLVTTTAESEVSIKPGGQTKMLVKIERRNGFKGRVPLDVKGLPHGVRVLDIGLNGILVNENETSRTVVLYAEPWVRAQDHPFVVLAKREGKNTEHAAKSVMLKVK